MTKKSAPIADNAWMQIRWCAIVSWRHKIDISNGLKSYRIVWFELAYIPIFRRRVIALSLIRLRPCALLHRRQNITRHKCPKREVSEFLEFSVPSTAQDQLKRITHSNLFCTSSKLKTSITGKKLAPSSGHKTVNNKRKMKANFSLCLSVCLSVTPSPDIILWGWLGSKHQLPN